MMRPTLYAAVLAGFFGLTLAGSAAAQQQPWLADRGYGQGIGYDVGSFVLHPSLAGEFGYDSNMYLRAPNEDVVDVWRLRITPSLSMATSTPQGGPEKYRFSAGVAASYNEYFAAGDTREDVSSFRNVGASADADLTVNPEGQFGGRFYGNLVRTIQPSNFSDTTAAYNRIHLRGGAELIWKPGGGLFDWRLGYEYGTTLFEEDRFETLNSSSHGIRTRGRWRFLPRTALLFDAATSFTRYEDPGTNAYLLDSNPIRARVGLNGLMTDRLALLAMVGWGASFHEAGAVPIQNFDGPIGQAQITYFPTPAPGLSDSERDVSLTLSRVALGYVRDFESSYFGSYYGRDRGYLRASAFFAQRLLVAGEGGISRVHFPTLYFANGGERTGSFNETRYDASLHTEYRIIPTVGVNATVSYDKNDSISMPTSAGTTDLDDLSYDRVQAFVGVRWFM